MMYLLIEYVFQAVRALGPEGKDAAANTATLICVEDLFPRGLAES